MNNLEFIELKINVYGIDISSSIEKTAMIYLIGLGFDVYKSINYETVSSISAKYCEKEFEKQLIKVLIEDKNGMPDLVAIKDDHVTFIEIKRVTGRGADSLHQNQLKWINEHQQYKVLVIGLEADVSEDQSKHIVNLKKEMSILHDRIHLLERNNDKVRYEVIDKLQDLLGIIERRKLNCDVLNS